MQCLCHCSGASDLFHEALLTALQWKVLAAAAPKLCRMGGMLCCLSRWMASLGNYGLVFNSGLASSVFGATSLSWWCAVTASENPAKKMNRNIMG